MKYPCMHKIDTFQKLQYSNMQNLISKINCIWLNCNNCRYKQQSNMNYNGTVYMCMHVLYQNSLLMYTSCTYMKKTSILRHIINMVHIPSDEISISIKICDTIQDCNFLWFNIAIIAISWKHNFHSFLEFYKWI